MPEIDFRSFDWDDSQLIQAYKTVLKDRKAKANKPKPEWKVGDHCRAIYPIDDFYYEAKIIDIDDICVTVEFLGYNETEYASIEELEESKGINAQREQIEAALIESRDPNAFQSHEWDDNELITAYKMGIESKKDKEITDYNSDSPLPEVKSCKWKRLDHCRAIYPADNLYREAKIVNLNGDFCTIEFLGYGDTKDVDLRELKESKGKKARKKQVKAVMTASCDKNSSVNESETSGNAADVDVAVASCSDPSKKKKHRVKRTAHDKTSCTTMNKTKYCKKCYAAAPAYPMPTNLTFRPPTTNMPQKSTPCVPHLNLVPHVPPIHHNSVPCMCQNPVPCMHQNPVPCAPPIHHNPVPCAPPMHQNSVPHTQSMYPNSVPHVPPMHRNSVLSVPPMPPCSCFANNTAFYSMLSAWYMAGYYTGIYSLKSA